MARMRLKNRRYRAPSGIRNCWMLWRHCCCRFGLYPLAVAPCLTAACLLSLYTSSGCAFLDLSVGFVPSNSVWNQSDMELGLFYYHSTFAAASDDNNLFQEYLHKGCRTYPADFQEALIARDRTWTVARLMAYISAAASAVAAFVTWMMVMTPLPAGCLWPGILLPLVIMALIAEGSKFLLFDIALCRNEVWFPSGIDSLPTTAESCGLGTTAYACIAAAAFFLICLLMVCLKAPEKRVLDQDFGIEYRTGAELDLEATDEDEDNNHYPSHTDPGFAESVIDEDMYIAETAHDHSQRAEHSSSGGGATSDPEDGISTLASTLASESPRNPVKNNTTVDLREDPLKPPPPPVIVNDRVSESRLSTMSKIEMSAKSDSEDLLQQLVSDLDTSFEKQLCSPIQVQPPDLDRQARDD